MMDYTEKFDEDINMEHVANSALDMVEPNKIMKGEIVTIDNEFAYVNVGTKSEGRVSLDEFADPPRVGSMVHVMLVSKRPIDGMFVFSMNAAEKAGKWQNFLEWFKAGNEYISGVVGEVVSKGMIINCDGVSAFLPFSQSGDLKFRKAPKGNESFTFKIKQVDVGKQRVILSRKEYIDEENVKIWDGFIAKYNEGSKVTGKVMRFVDDGAIISVDGVEAFLNKENISWKKVFKKRNILKPSEEREFLILSIDAGKKSVLVGLKQLYDDPWSTAGEKFQPGNTVTGKVVTVTNFGIFIEVGDGIEGLVNSSDISWTKKNINPADLFRKGETVEARVLSIDAEERKMSLGLKQLQENPWDTIHERFPLGSVFTKPVKKVVNFGMFVELEEDIDGLIHISDVSWDDDQRDFMKRYNTGDMVEFKILEIKKDQMKIACGIKQLTKSPWEAISEKYPPRSRVSGVVSKITNFGLFVKIEDGIEGLVHISEVSRKKIDEIEDYFKVGDTVNAVVLGVDVDKKRMSLSIKHYDMIMEKEELNRVLNDAAPGKVTLGDILKDKLQ